MTGRKRAKAGAPFGDYTPFGDFAPSRTSFPFVALLLSVRINFSSCLILLPRFLMDRSEENGPLSFGVTFSFLKKR